MNRVKVKSEVIWALLLIGTAAIFFFLGTRTARLEADEESKVIMRERADKISALEEKIHQLSDELASRGIFSYPQANVVSKMQDSVAMVLITLNGKDHIENLKLKRKVIYDYSKGNSAKAVESEKMYDLGILKPHNPAAFDIPLPQQEVALHITYESNRKKWQQYILIKKAQDGKIRSFWVITNQNSVVIDKHMDSGFPVDAQGMIRFWNGESVEYSDLELNSIFSPDF